MAANHRLPLVPPKKDSEHFKIKHGPQCVAIHMISRKEHGKENLTNSYE